MKFRRTNLFIAATVAMIVGCKKPNSYSDVPEIAFKSISIQQENGFDVSAHLIISFTDGDGDIGYNSSGNGNPYDDPTSIYYRNFIVKLDTLHNGNWGRSNNDSIFSGRIPNLTPSGSNKALKGEIATDVIFLYGHPNDTVRYEVHIFDRALNESNTIITPEIIIHTE